MNDASRIFPVIIGGLHHNTLGVIRSLGEQGVPAANIKVLLVGAGIEDDSFIARSKYVIKSNVAHVETNGDILVWLKTIPQTIPRRTIVCCSDGAASVVLGHHAELMDKFASPSISLDVSSCMDKEIQGKQANSSGFNVPNGKVINTNNYAEWNSFPCIIKPLSSISGSNKEDIHIARDANELRTSLGDVSSDYVQIQEFIRKQMEYQLIGCSLEAGNRLIIPGYTVILRQPPNTNTGYLRYCPIQHLPLNESAIRNFMFRIGYSGLFSLEFIRDFSGKDYFLEINLRNDGNAYCVTSAGVNLPYIWCYYCTYNQVPDCKTAFDKEIRFIPDFFDYRLGVDAVGFTEWTKQFFKADSHSIYNLHDIKPFLHVLTSHLGRR